METYFPLGKSVKENIESIYEGDDEYIFSLSFDLWDVNEFI